RAPGEVRAWGGRGGLPSLVEDVEGGVGRHRRDQVAGGGRGLREGGQGQANRDPRLSGEAVQAPHGEGQERRPGQQGQLRREGQEGAHDRGRERGRPRRREPLQRARHSRRAREEGGGAGRIVGGL